MPTDLLTTDINFPKYKSDKKLPDRVDEMQNYLYMLLEQLRYTLGNLDMRNFNQDALSKFSGTITEPLLARLEGTEGELTAFQVALGQIASQVSDAEGNISQLSQTVNGLSSRVTSAEGSISQLSQTAESLTSRITDAEGNLSQLSQTVTGLTSQVSDTQGNVSQLSQTVSGLTTRVTSAEGNISQLSQTVNGFALQVTNGETTSTIALTSGGAVISSQTINMQGLVSFSSLSTAGATTINGANITTGTISAITMSGNTITGGTITGSKIRSVGGFTDGLEFYANSVSTQNQVGGFHYDPTQANLFLYTSNSWALKLKSSGGMSIESGSNIYMDANDYITIDSPQPITIRHSSAGNYIRITENGVDLRGNVYVNGNPIS